MCARVKEPFTYHNREEFHTNLVDWIGDVLYDFLPDHGYEVRDEQIFTAFQIADAICEQKVHMAEAGLGTGKTFAYLLSAIPYARFTGKPVIIACATSALQEQLTASDGDIQTLSRLLDLDVDVRMAKDPNEYICDVRVTENSGEFGEMSDEINEWLNTTKFGERAEMPTIPDAIWKKIKWQESLACDTCSSRGFCKLVKAREHYRKTTDLIIVDHETFFHDLWTREERIDNRQLPILPNYSAVIFDEGHKVLLPAAMQAGHQINREEMDAMIFSIEEIQGARESLSYRTMAMEQAYKQFFSYLYKSVVKGGSSNRLGIRMSEPLVKAAAQFKKTLDNVLLELQIEQGLFIESLTETEILAFEGQIERATVALDRFIRFQTSKVIPWVDKHDGSFWVVPRNIGAMLEKQLYSKKLPVVFTSATLSNEGDFDYFNRTLGIKEASTSTIGSSFDLENQVVVYLAKKEKRLAQLAALLKKNGGRALVLTNSIEEVKRIRKGLEKVEFPFELLWEDQADRGYLARKFRKEETSVLIGSDYWEGIDVPGESLTLLVIWDLPFPALDPLIEVQRKEAKAQDLDPVVTIDYPEMGLKLKQGCGRLIRTEEDHGIIVILDSIKGEPWESIAMGALPKNAKVKQLTFKM